MNCLEIDAFPSFPLFHKQNKNENEYLSNTYIKAPSFLT